MTLPLADLVLILPELLIVGMACLILVLDPITPAHKKDLLAWMSLGILVVGSVVTVNGFGERVMAFSDLVVVDSYAVFWKMLLYLVSGLTILLSMGYLKEEKIQLAEYYAFVLLALTDHDGDGPLEAEQPGAGDEKAADAEELQTAEPEHRLA